MVRFPCTVYVNKHCEIFSVNWRLKIESCFREVYGLFDSSVLGDSFASFIGFLLNWSYLFPLQH